MFVNNTFVGIEVKAPDSSHKLSHIQTQIEWGANIIKNGGQYYIGSDFDEIKHFIASAIEDKFSVFDSIERVQKQINEGRKTIKFWYERKNYTAKIMN